MSQEVVIIVLGVFGIWLMALSAFFYWLLSHYKKLTKDAKGADLKKILDSILSESKINKKEIVKLDRQLNSLEKQGKLHIQKVGLIRFNPFKETGGDHSFSLALMDGLDKGFVITGLHTRERTRVYVKPIKNGQSKYELAKEEQEAVKNAE